MVNAETQVIESRTRDRVLRVVSQEGPVSSAALVARLGLTETARRHGEVLHAEGLLESREAAGPKRRGRPAKEWVLTEHGHRALVSDYDHLAGEALRFLGATAIATPNVRDAVRTGRRTRCRATITPVGRRGTSLRTQPIRCR